MIQVSVMSKVFLLLLLLSGSVYAATEMVVIPSAWKLENNIGNRPEIWYAGSSCVNGRLTFSVAATTEDKDRFYATIAAAKMAGKKIFVYYDDSSPGCEIISFGFPAE